MEGNKWVMTLIGLSISVRLDCFVHTFLTSSFSWRCESNCWRDSTAFVRSKDWASSIMSGVNQGIVADLEIVWPFSNSNKIPFWSFWKALLSASSLASMTWADMSRIQGKKWLSLVDRENWKYKSGVTSHYAVPNSRYLSTDNTRQYESRHITIATQEPTIWDWQWCI